jgi:hypothetical protein
MNDPDNEQDKINKRLQSIEIRLNRLESAYSIVQTEKSQRSEEQDQEAEHIFTSELINEEVKGLESQIGQFGLAWLGNIVLLFGIIFLTQYLLNQGQQYISVLIGYSAVVVILFIANRLKKSNAHLTFMFRMNAPVLLFYITLRLHFFSESPLVSSRAISIIILLIIVALQAYLSIRNKSQAYAFLTLLFVLSTAILSDSTHLMLPLVTLTAAGSIFYFYRFKWRPLLVTSIFLTYTSFFLWMLGNPLAGHPMQLITEQHSGAIYLFGLGAFFSTVLLLRTKDRSSDDFLTGVTFVNGILFTLLLVITVLRFYNKDYVSLFAVITVCCLVYSTILHSVSGWNFASAYYALYGFMAMTISLYGIFGLPVVYLLLSVQSLIVVSMALWFRNKLIVVMNSILFLTILILYLLSSKSIDQINFSFVVISLISARIINWKKSRLQIKTDLIRNLYMIEGFLMMLYSLFHAVPKQFITLSWTLAALLYFLISILLKNIKYRYMALGTMMCAAFYLFIIDLARIEIIYRVMALLFLAAISIGISMYYANRTNKSGN